ncbi:ABC transporter ATP-binding protein [Xanthobacter autotrophicus DSM 597]|uniref:ABC transporter ATP-binding protein n=1 Tax=Xanthobacter TaxID=279 RepID=UPI001AE6D960|nr:ABC transporter ATP-binding protein [Xanthobacter flavus]MBP2151030.1 ABC-type branched-subunit amino acid transport system ATPase component [Xanthobacter flavus]
MNTPILLSARGLSRSFGGNSAVQDVTLELHQGVVTALAGPNGAGKTTLFNLITGHLAPDRGAVELKGASILGLKPHRVALKGIARSFQDLRLFGSMSVYDNVLSAIEPTPWLWQPGGSSGAAARRLQVERALDATGLAELAGTRAIDLSYAETKFLSMARIIATGAPIWLLDEPASGLDPASRSRFVKLVKEATAAGVTVCLIEHNLDIVTELADRIAFLDQGRKLAEGTPDEILGDAKLIAIYFGERRE